VGYRPALFVDLAPMCDAGYGDKSCRIVDEINYAPITDSNAPLVPVASQFLAPWRAGIIGQSQDLAVNPLEHRIVQSVQFPLRRVFDFERILSHGGVRVSGGSRGIARRECPFLSAAIQTQNRPRNLARRRRVFSGR